MNKPWNAVMPTVSVADVAQYWDTDPQGSQFLLGRQLEIGSMEFFEEVRPYADCFRFPYFMVRIEEEARQLRGKHLLEIGCGLGFDAIEFMRRGVRVTATDLTPTNVALAKRHFDLAGVRPEAVEVQDVFQLPYADATFDAAYSIGVLIHAGAPGRALKVIHRLLRPGGRAIMCHFHRRPSLFHALSLVSALQPPASSPERPLRQQDVGGGDQARLAGHDEPGRSTRLHASLESERDDPDASSCAIWAEPMKLLSTQHAAGGRHAPRQSVPADGQRSCLPSRT